MLIWKYINKRLSLSVEKYFSDNHIKNILSIHFVPFSVVHHQDKMENGELELDIRLNRDSDVEN